MLINIEYITKIVQHLNQKVESMQHANLRKNKNILLKRYLKSVGNGPQNWIKLTDLQKEEFGQDLIKLTDIAYARTRLGSFVKTQTDVNSSNWLVLRNDKGDICCAIFYRSARPDETWVGNKVQGLSHDGSRTSKYEVIIYLKHLLMQPGWWSESRDSAAKALLAVGAPVVTDEKLATAIFPNLDLKMTDNTGMYTRLIADRGTEITDERIFGKPVSKHKSIINEYIQLLTEIATDQLEQFNNAGSSQHQSVTETIFKQYLAKIETEKPAPTLPQILIEEPADDQTVTTVDELRTYFESIENGKYLPGQKYCGRIPEIKYLPVSAIERQHMDFRPEVMTVSDEVARNMDYSEPVDVTAYHHSQRNDTYEPKVTLTDGHHRTAAALQTGREWLPVNVKAINARGEKINALIALSNDIEHRLTNGQLRENFTILKISDLAEKYKCSLGMIEIELKRGINIEMTKGNNFKSAKLVALKNINNNLNYYKKKRK